MTDISGNDSLAAPPAHTRGHAAGIGTAANQAAQLAAQLAGLMPRISAGEQAAFEQFYRLTLSRAHALVRRIVQDSHAIDDVLEEAYWQVWRDSAQYMPERGAVLAWFMTICRTRALDYLRKQGPMLSYADPLELQSEDEALELATLSPPDLLAACQAQGLLHEAIALLPARERQMIALAFFRDYSYPEIAEAFDMPLSSVKTILRRAFARLKGALQQHDISPTLQ